MSESPPSNGRTVRAAAPGKIILSGEHAVVHGAPALVTAVRRHAHAVITSRADAAIRIQLPDLDAADTFAMEDVRQLGAAVAERHEAFLGGRIDIEAVLEKPSDLIQLALLAYAYETLGRDIEGLDLNIASAIPVGRGMGSSAAVIVVVLRALAELHDQALSRERLEGLARDVERFQHGRPSGADVHACVHGGSFLYRRGDEAQPRDLALGSFYLADTGKPVSGTGECVEAVRRGFEGDAIWREFEGVTLALEDALGKPSGGAVGDVLRRNHQLLVRIGIVPRKVEAFIDTLHDVGYAAKVCGAGAVRGDHAGIVLVYGEDAPEAICAAAGYSLSPLEPDEDGVRIID